MTAGQACSSSGAAPAPSSQPHSAQRQRRPPAAVWLAAALLVAAAFAVPAAAARLRERGHGQDRFRQRRGRRLQQDQSTALQYTGDLPVNDLLELPTIQLNALAAGAQADVLLTLSTSGRGNADLFCVPSWDSAYADSPPSPSNALWFSEQDVGLDQIFISSDDPNLRPAGADRENGTTAYQDYVPGFNCSVVNVSPNFAVHFDLRIDVIKTQVNQVATEQAAMLSIWDQCCAAVAGKGLTGAAVSGAGLQPTDELCGQWVANNELFGKAPTDPYTNFCAITGNICDDTGHITQLSLRNYNLVCEFPVDSFLELTNLQSLDMSGNAQVTSFGGDVANIFDVLTSVTDRVLPLTDVSFKGNSKMSGSLALSGDRATTAGICKLAKTTLVSLDMAYTNLTGGIPGCLFESGSTLQELHVDFNNLSGSLPDTFTAASPIVYLTAIRNNLTGPLPTSLAAAPQLLSLDVTLNSIDGPIPAAYGDIATLQFLYLSQNNLSGTIASSFAKSSTLEALDVARNGLSGLPDEWYVWTGSDVEAMQPPLVELNLAFNSFTGVLPPALSFFPYLQVFYVNDNAFSGNLTDTGSAMFPSLRRFNASHNALSGTIPPNWGVVGIFQLNPVTQYAVNYFTENTQADAATQTSFYEPHVFDLSHNNLTGPIPDYLESQYVAPYVQNGVFVSYNDLEIDCNAVPSGYDYLTHNAPANGASNSNGICPQNVFSSETVIAATPATAPAAAPSSGQQPASAPTSTSTSASSSSGPSSQTHSGGGLNGGAIAGIVVGCVLALLVAALITWLVRRRAVAHGGLSRSFGKNAGFDRYNDMEMAGPYPQPGTASAYTKH